MFSSKKVTVTEIELLNVTFLQKRNRRNLTPCKMCRRYDDKVREQFIPTGMSMGQLHPWCASQIIHEAMKELINRMQ